MTILTLEPTQTMQQNQINSPTLKNMTNIYMNRSRSLLGTKRSWRWSKIINTNSLFYTCVYMVEIPDGTVDKLSDNLVYENLFVHCNNYGFMYHILDEISGHKSTGYALMVNYAFIQPMPM